MNKDKLKKTKAGIIPALALTEVARVMSYGADKHGRESWKEGEVEIYIDALTRHFLNVLDDYKSTDEETNCLHLTHLACNCLILASRILEEQNVKVSDILSK